MTATSTLSSSARRALRAAAHHLDPVVMMGQHGLTPAVLHEIDLALTAHALIKVRAGSDERETREGYLAEICQKLGCESVQHLGKLFVLWRNADGGADDDQSAEQDAATLTASRGRKAAAVLDAAAAPARGPRSKLASERTAGAAARAGAAPGSRGGAAAGSRSGATAGSRSGATAGSRSGASGERRRWGEAPPEPPRREGWAPKDRRGAARFGETENNSGSDSYGAPRGRAPVGGAGRAGGGYGSSAPRGTGAPSAGRAGYAPGGRSGYGSDDRGAGGGQGGGQGYGDRGGYGRGGQGGGQGGQEDAAPRARWGDRREPSQGGGYGDSNAGGGRFGDDRGRGSFGDNAAPKQRSSFGRNSDAAGAGRPPRTGGHAGASGGASSAPVGGRGGWGNRDAVTGKPSGFSRGGAGGGGRGGAGAGAGAANTKPRARRRMG